MEIHEVQGFVDSMKAIESFLSELAARESELRYSGLGGSKLWESYEDAKDSFEGFDRHLYELIRLSRFVDKDLYKRISDIAASSGIAEGITQISVSVRISEIRRERDIAFRKAATSLLDIFVAVSASILKTSIVKDRGIFFTDFDVSLSEILVGLSRLIPLTEEVLQAYNKKKLGDDEVFKPANIDIDSIHLYVQNTIGIVKENPGLGPDTKEKLLEYLEDIRLELAKETPKWKTIVGALVIVSTILGGLAVAPQAIENIQNAVTEILGTSIEKRYPHSVPERETALPNLIMT